MNANGSSPTRLTSMVEMHPGTNNVAVRVGLPHLSPDGNKVAFVRLWSEFNPPIPYNEIYVMNANGTGQTRLTNSSEGGFGADWCPGGARIAFTRSVNGNKDIYTMKADRTDQRRLTNFPTEAGFPEWSPNGSQIVFHLFGAGLPADPNEGIYVINADGTGQKLVEVPLGQKAVFFFPSIIKKHE